MAWLGAALGALVLSIMGTEITGWVWHAAKQIAERAASRMPDDISGEYRDTFLGELDVLQDRPVSALIVALRMLRDSRMTARVATGAPPSLVLKHVIEFVLAGVMVLILVPVLLVLALVVRLRVGSPVMDRQVCVGKDGEHFDRLGFATVRTFHSQGKERALIPPVGRFLQRSGMENLPELLNVIKGDMSIVGPRPREVGMARFSGDDPRFHFRPGLTGTHALATDVPTQENSLASSLKDHDNATARYLVSQFQELVDSSARDKHYVERWSLSMDIRVIARSVREAIRMTR